MIMDSLSGLGMQAGSKFSIPHRNNPCPSVTSNERFPAWKRLSAGGCRRCSAVAELWGARNDYRTVSVIRPR